MVDVISSLEMSVIDRNCEYFGLPRRVLMELAGRGIAEIVRSRFPGCRNVLVVSGLGDNGGDGIVAAKYLHKWGYDVKVLLLGKIDDIRSDIARENAYLVRDIGVEIHEAPTATDVMRLSELFAWPDLIIDAILGTGVRGLVREPQRTAIKLINESKKTVVAVDIPSGLDPDTGEVLDVAVRATITGTMHKIKPGLLKNREHAGEVVVIDIGIPEEFEHVVGPGDLLYLRYERPPESKKGDFGRIVIVGGSDEFTGAPALSALAAYRLGCDLAIIVAPESAAHDMRSMSPNLIVKPVQGKHFRSEHVDEVLKLCERAHAVLIGPGITTRDEVVEFTCRLVEKLNKIGKPVVIDADGIKAIAVGERYDITVKNVVLTPHMGEFKMLTHVDLKDIRSVWSRAREATRIVSEKLRGATVVIKGNVDVITDGVRYKLNFTGNPGMTVGGTGDVLSGAIAALCARISDVFEAASIATFIVGLAGDLAVKSKGYHVVPTDVIEMIPETFRRLLDVDKVVEKALHRPSLRLLETTT